MSLLKKIGIGIIKGAAAFAGFAPLIQQAFPQFTGQIGRVSNELDLMADTIVSIEAASQAIFGTDGNGEQKLKMAAPLVANVLLKSALVANHKIAKEDLFRQSAAKFADATADLLNSLDEK